MSNDPKEFAELVNSKRLYCQVFVPRFGLEDFKRGSYSGWYLCHHSAGQLEEDVIEKLYEEWSQKDPDPDDMEAFFYWLGDLSRADWQGHIVLYTAGEGIGVVPMD